MFECSSPSVAFSLVVSLPVIVMFLEENHDAMPPLPLKHSLQHVNEALSLRIKQCLISTLSPFYKCHNVFTHEAHFLQHMNLFAHKARHFLHLLAVRCAMQQNETTSISPQCKGKIHRKDDGDSCKEKPDSQITFPFVQFFLSPKIAGIYGTTALYVLPLDLVGKLFEAASPILI